MESVKAQDSVFNNKISNFNSERIQNWTKRLSKKFSYNPEEKYILSAVDNSNYSSIFNIRNIARNTDGTKIDKKNSILISTSRESYDCYRKAIAAASCANALGYSVYWLDLLSVPGITTDITHYLGRKSRPEHIPAKLNLIIKKHKHLGILAAVITEGLNRISSTIQVKKWNRNLLKSNVRDRRAAELFRNLFMEFPQDIPCISVHALGTKGALSAGMTNVVHVISDNYASVSDISEGALHSVPSASVYHGFRILKNSGIRKQLLQPVPEQSFSYNGHHIDHEIVDNIENDCRLRLNRMKKHEPRRLLLTTGNSQMKYPVFRSIIDHCIPSVQTDKSVLLINLGNETENWTELQKDISKYGEIIQVHSNWEETRNFCDRARNGKIPAGIHIFLNDDIFQGIYAVNYLMRISDIMITEPCSLAAYPVPKIITKATDAVQKANALLSAENGDGTEECLTSEELLHAIDFNIENSDLIELYCSCIARNKTAGIYDGAYMAVSIAAGKKYDRLKINQKTAAGKTKKGKTASR